jgi:hypothetical protein
MSSIGTLYSYPKYTKTLVVSNSSWNTLDPRPAHRLVSQVQAVAAWAGLKVDLPSDYAHYQTNKQPEFLAKFPHGKVPALDSADGFKLTEGGAIARYGQCPRLQIINKSHSAAARHARCMKRFSTLSVIPVLRFTVETL